VIYGLYNSAAGMMVNEYRQGVLANNIANAETTGFKREIAVFSEREPARLAGVRHGPSNRDLQTLSGGLWLGKTFTDYSEGTKVPTDNPLDVTLEGPGFLSVGVDGQRQFTRDGRLAMNADGVLVAAIDGAPLLGRGGQPIRMNPFGGQPQIDTDGNVSQDGAVMGQLEIVDFDDYGALRKVGSNRFVSPDETARPSPALLQSGYTESSGVEAIRELVGMIDASRAYQMNAEMVRLQDQSVGQLINVISRV
jgi:flagellar basal body rod protein FlgG